MSSPVRVLALTRYGMLGASSRLRTLQYLPTLIGAGMSVHVQSLFVDDALQMKYHYGQYGWMAALKYFAQRLDALCKRHDFDLLWIEKEALPWWPLWVEAALLRGVPYVLDYDDAIFHNYDLHRLAVVRSVYGRRLDGLMANAALVVCGNEYLAQRARQAGAAWVEVLPTVIDLDRYPLSEAPHKVLDIPRIVWIGSPSTARYLNQLTQPLQELSQKVPFVLRVIGANFEAPGVKIECIPWLEATEVGDISACDVGIMPLQDSPWELGKCGYKLIQYMACGLPVVASPVGVNKSIVQDGLNGYLADNAEDWLGALEGLLLNSQLRKSMGVDGRQQVERLYCLQVTGPRLSKFLMEAAKKI